MRQLFTAPGPGLVVLAVLLCILAIRLYREARGRSRFGPGWVVGLLVAVFAAQLVARFLLV
jgi:hypothetical protein